MKKGSNLISTGKSTVVKEGTLQGAGISLLPPAGASPAAGSAQTAAGIRYINVVHRSPVESPQSPTKVDLICVSVRSLLCELCPFFIRYVRYTDKNLGRRFCL